MHVIAGKSFFRSILHFSSLNMHESGSSFPQSERPEICHMLPNPRCSTRGLNAVMQFALGSSDFKRILHRQKWWKGVKSISQTKAEGRWRDTCLVEQTKTEEKCSIWWKIMPVHSHHLLDCNIKITQIHMVPLENRLPPFLLFLLSSPARLMARNARQKILDMKTRSLLRWKLLKASSRVALVLTTSLGLVIRRLCVRGRPES